MIDRLRQGNWFEDSSIACRQTCPMVIDTIKTDEDREEIFSQRQSLYLAPWPSAGSTTW
jgi:CreA protein